MPGQAHRLVFMYRKFLEGNTYTSSQLQDIISEQIEIVSIRTIQRDLRLLQKIDPNLIGKPRGKEILWYIPKEHRLPKTVVRFESNELLAFHFLKAHLKTFIGTSIEKDALKLYDKLEKLAPAEVVLDETIYWDQNIGYYDYSKINDIVDDVIKYTASKDWVYVSYTAPKSSQSKEFLARFETIFSYLGLLYVVAYIPKHKVHVSLAIHNISEIRKAEGVVELAPPFNFKEWSLYRFGVFSGEIKNIKLLIKQEFKHFFLNRMWHPTQAEKFDKDGNLILEMQVPIGVDLLNWILSWSDAIIVLEPKELVNKVLNRLTQAIANYKEYIAKDVVEEKPTLEETEPSLPVSLQRAQPFDSKPKFKASIKRRK